MPEYVVLIYGDEQAIDRGGQQLFDELLEGHVKFGTNNHHAIRDSRALQPTNSATSLRTDENGTVTVKDGPLVPAIDTPLTGYYVIEADTLDAAIATAKQVPAPHGGVEIRPVMTFD
jgi:hypothetical protein